MAKLDNPAGRVHSLLSRYSDAGSKVSVRAAWASALGVSENSVTRELGRVAALIPSIDAAVETTEDAELRNLYEEFVAAWARPIFTPECGITEPAAKAPIQPAALSALGSLSSFLSRVAPEGVIPSESELEKLRDELAELMNRVRNVSTDDLPADVRALLLDRLHDIAQALNQLGTAGPAGVQAAVERLVGRAATSPHIWDNPVVNEVVKWAMGAWAIFNAGPAFQTSLEAWHHIMQALPPG